MLTKSILQKLLAFRIKVSFADFKAMFSKTNMDVHLWNKFSNESNSDLLDFCIRLDDSNKNILIDYINSNY
ncbi:hypothetical protein [Polaribacter sp. 11A2H]|uniref:hypothetical protein n=1 Tax=Polaribacter sp. 11A2H TaxID=2687290 RepID=UPI00140E26C7|nr:hypothetical protein [Polaribacter sp. 11A2H]